jgi:hypothetical protein
MNVGQVWATSFSPNPPVAGQPFTITSGGGSGVGLSVYESCGCNGGCAVTAGSSPLTLTLPTAGQYNVFDEFDSSCTSFTVVPAISIPEYPAPTYGLPLLVIFMVLAYAVIKRRILTGN